MDITNNTNKPLSIPLPGGKKLFLGPRKTGQITPKALEHPPVAKLIEAGDIATAEGGNKPKQGGSGNTGVAGGSAHKGTGAMRQSGDR